MAFGKASQVIGKCCRTVCVAVAGWAGATQAYPTIPDGFEPYHEESAVAVGISRDTSREPWIRGVGRIDARCENVMKVAQEVASYSKVFAEAIDKLVVLSSGDDAVRVHIVWGLPFPMDDRDAVVRYVRVSERELRWIDDPASDVPVSGIRILKVAGSLILTDVTSPAPGCDVTYTYFGELGGDLPRFVKERAWKHEPVYYIEALRMAVVPVKPTSL